MRPFRWESSEDGTWDGAILIAAPCVLLGYLARVLIDFFIHDQAPFVTFYPAVIAASPIGGFRAGVLVVLVSTPLAVLAFNRQYPIATTIVWLTLATIVAAGCGVAQGLSARLRAEKQELEATKRKLELVVREQAPRAKNPFAILNALAALSAQVAANVEDFRDRLIERIKVLSAAHALMSSAEPDPPVDLALEPFRRPLATGWRSSLARLSVWRPRRRFRFRPACMNSHQRSEVWRTVSQRRPRRMPRDRTRVRHLCPAPDRIRRPDCHRAAQPWLRRASHKRCPKPRSRRRRNAALRSRRGALRAGLHRPLTFFRKIAPIRIRKAASRRR